MISLKINHINYSENGKKVPVSPFEKPTLTGSVGLGFFFTHENSAFNELRFFGMAFRPAICFAFYFVSFPVFFSGNFVL